MAYSIPRCVFILALLAVPVNRAALAETALGCEKPNAGSQYCKDGKRREACSQSGFLVWTDTRESITRGQFIYLSMDGPVVTPFCGCLDAEAACLKAGRSDCASLPGECTRSLSSGGRFCVANQWSGTTCY